MTIDICKFQVGWFFSILYAISAVISRVETHIIPLKKRILNIFNMIPKVFEKIAFKGVRAPKNYNQ